MSASVLRDLPKPDALQAALDLNNQGQRVGAEAITIHSLTHWSRHWLKTRTTQSVQLSLVGPNLVQPTLLIYNTDEPSNTCDRVATCARSGTERRQAGRDRLRGPRAHACAQPLRVFGCSTSCISMRFKQLAMRSLNMGF